jgi:hypothetical protein
MGRRSLCAAVRVSRTSLVFVGLRYYLGSTTTNTSSNCNGATFRMLILLPLQTSTSTSFFKDNTRF